jgi:hypothetical protein
MLRRDIGGGRAGSMVRWRKATRLFFGRQMMCQSYHAPMPAVEPMP